MSRLLHLPTKVTTAVSLVAGILAVLNQTTFHFGSHWFAVVTVALTFLAGLGIAPMVGAKFRNALHLSPAVSVAVSTALGALALVATSIHDSTVRGVLEGLLTFASGVGFGPSAALAPAPQPIPPAPVVPKTHGA